jgi:hypothetical protein
MRAEKADRSPTLRAMAATRTSAVLFTPRSVGAERVRTSFTFTFRRVACPSKRRTVFGCARSSSLPSTIRSTRRKAGSRETSTPPSTRSIDVLSETAFAQPRPRTA